MAAAVLYCFGMTRHSTSRRWCSATTQSFPIVATVAAVAACFGEVLFAKYFVIGRAVEIVLALGQAIPVGLLIRYFVARPRKSNQGLIDRAERVRRKFP
jgi:hypothetical protein